jgi:hypothetical protein
LDRLVRDGQSPVGSTPGGILPPSGVLPTGGCPYEIAVDNQGRGGTFGGGGDTRMDPPDTVGAADPRRTCPLAPKIAGSTRPPGGDSPHPPIPILRTDPGTMPTTSRRGCRPPDQRVALAHTVGQIGAGRAVAGGLALVRVNVFTWLGEVLGVGTGGG